MSIRCPKKVNQSWSEIPFDIFALIINRKKCLDLADVARVAAVCKWWGSILRDNNWFGLSFNSNIGKTCLPWLMLADQNSFDGINMITSSEKRKFVNPATGQISEVYLPETEGRRCCGSGYGYGWLVTMGEDMEISLVNPLTREKLSLPSQLTFTVFSNGNTNEEYHAGYSRTELRRMFIRKAILSCSPRTSECVVVLVVFSDRLELELAWAKPGNSAWTSLPLPPVIVDEHNEEDTNIEDLIFYQYDLFAMNSEGLLLVLKNPTSRHEKIWQILGTPNCIRTISHIIGPRVNILNLQFSYYLVEMVDGEFAVVFRGKQYDKGNNQTRKFFVFKLKKGEWLEVDHIGDCCLFVGNNQTTCFSPVPRGYYANCIYFTDDTRFTDDKYYQNFAPNAIPAGKDVGIFSMENGEISSVWSGASLSKFSPPIWVLLNYNM